MKEGYNYIFLRSLRRRYSTRYIIKSLT